MQVQGQCGSSRECGCGEGSAGAERSAGAMDARVLSAARCGYIYIYMRAGRGCVGCAGVAGVYGGADYPVLVVAYRRPGSYRLNSNFGPPAERRPFCKKVFDLGEIA